MLDTLVDAYGLDSAMFLYCLDEMMRRSQIATTAALNWASPKMLQLHQNTTLYTLFELIVERSVDFVRASLAQRSNHGDLMALDGSMDLTPAPEPEGVVAMSTTSAVATSAAVDSSSSSSSSAAVGATSEELDEVDYTEDNEGAEQREGKRQRRGSEGDEGMKTEEQQQQEQQQAVVETIQDPVWLTTEAVKTAVGNIRAVYGSLLGTLSRGIATARQQPNGPGNALWVVVAQSLILKTLRAVHGAERHLTQTYQRPVLLSDIPHKVALQLEGSELREIWNDHFKV